MDPASRLPPGMTQIKLSKSKRRFAPSAKIVGIAAKKRKERKGDTVIPLSGMTGWPGDNSPISGVSRPPGPDQGGRCLFACGLSFHLSAHGALLRPRLTYTPCFWRLVANRDDGGFLTRKGPQPSATARNYPQLFCTEKI